MMMSKQTFLFFSLCYFKLVPHYFYTSASINIRIYNKNSFQLTSIFWAAHAVPPIMWSGCMLMCDF